MPDLARTRLPAVAAAATLLLAACAGGADDPRLSPPASPTTADAGSPTGQAEGRMGEGMAADVPRLPPVFGYYEGEEVFFIHTEASDPQIADTLTGMMDSPVPVVPSLADMPTDALSPVYVFTNGVEPDDTPRGPLGFQPDVFATAPPDDGYTPMRQLVQVTWDDEDDARVLTSVDEIEQAEADGQLSLEPTGVVVVAPLVTWPSGQR